MGYNNPFRLSHLRRHGFALAEIMVALFFVTLAVVLVGGLFNQVMKLQKSSKQVGALVDIRMKTASIAKDTDRWLTQLRTNPEVATLYNGCIPEPGTSTAHSCPAKEASLYDASDILIDEKLRTLSSGLSTVTSAKIVDAAGDLIAGTEADPHHMNSDGALCLHADKTKCELKSVGYFMRQNDSGHPGSVKFVVKVEKNSLVTDTTPMKTQYMTMDLGSSWFVSTQDCASGSLKMGIQADGTAYCVPTTAGCATGEIAVGVDAVTKLPICSAPPNCTSGSYITVESGSLICKTATNPCPSGTAHMGYYSGTGAPICSSSIQGCGAGKIQTGMTVSGDTLTPLCKSLSTCLSDERLSYDGSDFTCVPLPSSRSSSSSSTGIPNGKSCQNQGSFVKGINENGSLNCETVPAGTTLPKCTLGQVLVAKANGTFECKNPDTLQSTFGCNNDTKGLIRHSANKYQKCNGTNWVDVSVVEESCVNRRSKTLEKDSVFWCPDNYPTLYSCKPLDNEAPNGRTVLPSDCHDDGACSAADKNKAALLRTTLGADGFYLETVNRADNANSIQGCWAYDDGHSHHPYKLEIMCCK